MHGYNISGRIKIMIILKINNQNTSQYSLHIPASSLLSLCHIAMNINHMYTYILLYICIYTYYSYTYVYNIVYLCIFLYSSLLLYVFITTLYIYYLCCFTTVLIFWIYMCILSYRYPYTYIYVYIYTIHLFFCKMNSCFVPCS